MLPNSLRATPPNATQCIRPRRRLVSDAFATSSQRPKRRAKKPPLLFARAAATSVSVCLPLHHRPAGTVCLTDWMWLPHPAQVVFSQTLHVTALHTVASFIAVVGECPGRPFGYPGGYKFNIPLGVY